MFPLELSVIKKVCQFSSSFLFFFLLVAVICFLFIYLCRHLFVPSFWKKSCQSGKGWWIVFLFVLICYSLKIWAPASGIAPVDPSTQTETFWFYFKGWLYINVDFTLKWPADFFFFFVNSIPGKLNLFYGRRKKPQRDIGGQGPGNAEVQTGFETLWGRPGKAGTPAPLGTGLILAPSTALLFPRSDVSF